MHQLNVTGLIFVIENLNYSFRSSFNTLFLIVLGGIYLFWPDLMQVEGFWLSFIAIWLCLTLFLGRYLILQMN